MAGYSETPLVTKLGIKAGHVLYVHSPPEDYEELLRPLPEKVRIGRQWSERPEMIHVFCTERTELSRLLPDFRRKMPQDGVIWVSWPKKTSGVPSSITENEIRNIALPLGLVDTKVCAVSEIWSGLKLVIRVENRKVENSGGDANAARASRSTNRRR